jgi:Pyruvate/2-oxoacid:ferredoxin oxidoreductase delta subunit
MSVRKIVRIDEDKCNGCGQCVGACAEGAIQIVDGKAKLVSEVYCDGLGACLGKCPMDAITVEEREAKDFDEKKASAYVRQLQKKSTAEMPLPAHACPGTQAQSLKAAPHRGGCPGTLAQSLSPAASAGGATSTPSALANWPVQLKLVPPNAPYFQDADLLLVADCVPFAYADFHTRMLAGKPVVIGCPKLDDADFYVNKLAAILQASSIRSLTVAHMEVPCCTALARIAEAALAQSGQDIPLRVIVIGMHGTVLEER